MDGLFPHIFHGERSELPEKYRLEKSFVARCMRFEARREERAKKSGVYPLRYAEDFFAEFDEVAARIVPTAAKAMFESGYNDSDRSCR